MENRIYSKLFQFCDPKSWTKRESNNESTSYSSTFYPEYKLEFKCEGIIWCYYVYRKNYYNSSYEDNPCHKGFVTFNKSGKLLIFTVMFLLLLFGQKLFFSVSIAPSPWFIVYFIIGILMSLIFSIINWRIYLTLRKAQNCEKLKIKDYHEKLEKEIVQIVNKTVANNPKLARKKKLLQLEKKWFWQK